MYQRNLGRRWLRRLVAFTGVVLTATALGLALMTVFHQGPQEPEQGLPPTALPTPPWDSPSPPATARPAHGGKGRGPSLAGPVEVAQGRTLVNGVYLGFPHTTTGAVSAADEYTSVMGTLDPDRAAAAMRLIADPAFTAAPGQAAASTVGERQALGLPASGPVPAGDSLQVVPVEAQVRDVRADTVTVLLLADVITTLPGQGTQTQVLVLPVPLRWADADWKALPAGTGGYDGLAAEPGSPQAASLGWLELQPAGA